MAGTAPRWSHQAAFEANLASAAQARAYVTSRLVEHRLPYLVEAVRLVTSELATNALLHAHTAFAVTLEGWDEVVVLTVRDDSLSLPTRRSAQVTDPTGRGLEIVEIVSQAWGTNRDAMGSKAVWASFAVKGPRDF
jgi:anti-sigma regulatory factor (Ser/Thr protein kinase)